MSGAPVGQDPDDLDALGGELRERVGAEFRADAEEGERLAARQAARGRSFHELVAHLRNRGDRIAVTVGSHTLTGIVVFVANDYFRLRAPGAVFDCRFDQPLAIRVVEPARSGGTGPAPGSMTFRARLLELEDAAEVEVDTLAGTHVQPGRIAAVGRDHLVIAHGDGGESYVTVTAIASVATAEPDEPSHGVP